MPAQTVRFWVNKSRAGRKNVQYNVVYNLQFEVYVKRGIINRLFMCFHLVLEETGLNEI